MDNFNIHNWQAKFRRENKLNEENYGGRGSDLATVYQAAIELSAGEMEEFFEALSSYFYDNQENLGNFNAKEVAFSLDKASKIISQRTGN